MKWKEMLIGKAEREREREREKEREINYFMIHATFMKPTPISLSRTRNAGVISMHVTGLHQIMLNSSEMSVTTPESDKGAL